MHHAKNYKMAPVKNKPTQRFSNRVADYLAYRPSYPATIITLLKTECYLTPNAVIADIGSGTGLLTKLFLDSGNLVYGIEPNTEMRTAGEDFLEHYPTFTSLAATAEVTTLPDNSVDFVTVGQAFHWFNQAQAIAEFRRILKPNSWISLIWNERQLDTPFLQAYETLLQKYSPEYKQVDHRNVTSSHLKSLLGDGLHMKRLPNQQQFDFTGLKGRLMSSSYCPLPDDPNHMPLITGLQTAFETHQVNGRVTLDYLTYIYYCPIT